jgi:integrase
VDLHGPPRLGKRYHAMVILAAGTGLRQGEIFGLTLDRVDFLRRSARVDRQLVGIRGQAPTLGPPQDREQRSDGSLA